MIGFYVSVVDGERRGLLLGPLETQAEALENVERGRRLAAGADRDAHWYAYGTCRIEADRLPAGRLNGRS